MQSTCIAGRMRCPKGLAVFKCCMAGEQNDNEYEYIQAVIDRMHGRLYIEGERKEMEVFLAADLHAAVNPHLAVAAAVAAAVAGVMAFAIRNGRKTNQETGA